MGNSKSLIMEKKNAFMKIWECRDLGPISEYLCMKIVRDRIQKKLIIDQIDYAKKVVDHFGQQNAKPTYTPLYGSPQTQVPVVSEACYRGLCKLLTLIVIGMNTKG